MLMGFLALNDDIIVHISSFLSEEDRWTLIRKLDNHMLIALTKKAKVKFRLTHTASRRYYEDELFRQTVRLIIARDSNGKHFLSLNLRRYTDIADVSSLGGVHTLDLTNCSGITDVSSLGGVHALDLRGCSGITDVSSLGGVHHLNLSRCSGITDVSSLGEVHTLISLLPSSYS